MAYNSNLERKKDKESLKTGGLSSESCDSKKQLLSASTSATSKQNGDQAGCEDEQMSEQDASERRRSGLTDLKNCNRSPSTLHRPAEELPRINFQIPRKIKERKGLLQQLPPDSREFEELVKLLSSFYLETPSRGTFTYTKACLIHNELLEKEFIEKKRELKQGGRTDAELAESYGFLLPDKNKVHWICEKGLSVGHARITTLGNPLKGVYLSKYSDLLQMNPFEVGATGDIIIFKIMKGKLKNLFDNTPKSNLDPTPKFDCHVSKKASKVTSLLSYRAFEHTQQYFYEFAFEELKSRPKHVCPYAVLSFQYKGKEAATAAHRLSSTVYEGPRVRRRYTVWSGPLLNKGEELYQVCIRSSSPPFLPFKLPEKLDLSIAMQLDQVKRKIPLPHLFSSDTYSGSREVLKCGMYCSLFEVVSKTKQGNSLSALLHKLEREKIVLVKPLMDRGFLFLLSSTQMNNSSERRGRMDRSLQALFVFQEPRIVARFKPQCPGAEGDSLASLEPRDPIVQHVDAFVPALHHALVKMRSAPTKDLAAAVERHALDYLSRCDQGAVRPFYLMEYRQTLDSGGSLPPTPRPKHGVEAPLSSYLQAPAHYQLAAPKLSAVVGAAPGPSPPAGGDEEYSPVSDWGGSDRQAPAGGSGSGSKPGVSQANGGGEQRPRLPQGEYDKDKMEKLLRLIQLHKRTLGKDEESGAEPGDEGWDPAGLKRRLEDEGAGSVSKYLRTDLLSNGEPGRVPQGEEGQDEGQSPSLSAVMDRMGICDTDLRELRVSQNASINDTQRLLKLLLSTLNRAMAQGGPEAAELPDSLGADADRQPPNPTAHCDIDLRSRPAEEQPPAQEYLEEQTACSMSSMDVYSPCSISEQQQPPPAEVSDPSRMPWSVLPITDKVPECGADGLGAALVDLPDEGQDCQVPGQVVDAILNEEFQCLSAEIQGLMESQQIYYISELPPLWPLEHQLWQLNSAFSPFVAHYVSPLPVQGYVSALCDRMSRLVRHPAALADPVAARSPAPVAARSPAPATRSPAPATRSPAPAPTVKSPTPTIRSPAPAPTIRSTVPAPAPTIRSPAPAPAPTIRSPAPAPAPTIRSPAPAPAPAIRSPAPAPAPAIRSTAPAPAPTSRSTAPAPAPAIKSPAPTPAPAIKSPAPAPAIRSPAPTPAPAIRSPAPTPAPAIRSPAPTPAPAIKSPAPTPAIRSPAPANVVTSQAKTPAPVPKKQPPPLTKPLPDPKPRLGTVKEIHQIPPAVKKRDQTREGNPTIINAEGSLKCPSSTGSVNHPAADPPLELVQASGSVGNSVIGQLQPDVLCTLVEIMQMNAVRFYIHLGEEEEENDLCAEIKEYLRSLGNIECNPQSYLENNNSQQKFMIIIQNEDIAAHVHKIPALVSLKKFPSVYFAGVDSLDDVKNRTYNELFVSGGLIVSDDLVLNPDFITLERLQAFLTFLEEQSSPWKWKVHCKTQKKLKELSRVNSNALGMLNLLTTYQKKHLVEFLPYHECDAPVRQAPDLACMVKLQAQHTQLRHIIFLTERRFEMFPHFSQNGILIASIDEIMNSFYSLIGFNSKHEVPTLPVSEANDECVQEEDMSLDSEDDTLVIAETSALSQDGIEEVPPQPPPPQAEAFRPPLPDQPVLAPPLPPSSMSFPSPTPYPIDFSALKSAISQYKACNQGGGAAPDAGENLAASFGVNPHQSYLCPPSSSQWSPYSSSPGYPLASAYAPSTCPASQGQEYVLQAASRRPAQAPGGAGEAELSAEAPPLSDGAGLAGSSAGVRLPAPDNPSAAAEPAPLPSSLSAPLAYPDAVLATGFGWGAAGGPPLGYAGAPSAQNDEGGAGAGGGTWGGGAAPKSQAGGAAPSAPTPATPGGQGGGGEKSSAPSNQGSRTPANSSSESQGAGPAAAPNRGGVASRGLLPIPGAALGALCRGGAAGAGHHGSGYGSRGGMPGPMDGPMRGGFRARGMPPGAMRSRPGRGQIRGGSSFNWGFPPGRGGGGGQDYYSDYTFP